VPRPVHFEIHAVDPEAMATFYTAVFGWRIKRWGDAPYWLVTTGDGDPTGGSPHSEPGIDGGLLPRPGGSAPIDGQPVNAFVVTIDVPGCQAYVDRALAAGGSIALPVTPMPGIGLLAYVKDPDGNILGLLESERPAG
jgi:predicted enzyme related to lactoylglutathione lyase